MRRTHPGRFWPWCRTAGCMLPKSMKGARNCGPVFMAATPGNSVRTSPRVRGSAPATLAVPGRMPLGSRGKAHIKGTKLSDGHTTIACCRALRGPAWGVCVCVAPPSNPS
jgi:hypothetical protein